MTGLSGDWHRLAQYVFDRRTALDNMTQEDVRAKGGPSTATLRNIEGALQVSYKPASIAKLERALLWEYGSVAAILQGDEPRPIGTSPTEPVDQRQRRLRERIEAAVRGGLPGAQELLDGFNGPAEIVTELARAAGLTHEDFEGVREDVYDALLERDVADAMERSEGLNQESQAIIRRIRHRLGLINPKQLDLIDQLTADQLTAELARQREERGDEAL